MSAAGVTAVVSILSALGVFGSGLAGWKVFTRGNRTTFTANIWKRLAEVEAALTKEQADRQRETSALQAALLEFRERDGVWLELWHDGNVERTAAGLPAVQLPEKLRKWPQAIVSIGTITAA